MIIEKRKVNPSLQTETIFYPTVLGKLLKSIFHEIEISNYDEIIVLTDTIPLKRKRDAIQKEVKKVLKLVLPDNSKYRVMHHSSKSNICLQIVDYCSWAMFRKWERKYVRSYDLIKKGIKIEKSIYKDEIDYY